MSRRKGRYERRQQKRLQNKIDRGKSIGTLEDIFTFNDMFFIGHKCCNGVRWKQSIQNFESHLFSGTAKRRKEILSEEYKWKKYNHFELHERGVIREIDAPHIQDRQIHKILTNKVLLPCYRPLLIYRNGASLKGKGLSFTRKLLKQDLIKHYRKYKLSGSIIIIDFKKFFPSANREYIKNIHKLINIDSKIQSLLDNILDTFNGNKGVPLGVELSQIEMVMYPSKLDNYISCQLGLKVGHYMDDYYVLIPPNINSKEILKKIELKAIENKLTINMKKTHILKFGAPFKFCKIKYIITESGKIVTHANRDTIKRACRKLKKLYSKFINNKVGAIDIWAIIHSCNNYYNDSNDHGRIMKLYKRFYKIYNFPCDKYERFKEYNERIHNTY